MRRPRGTTLIELLVSISIYSFLALSLIAITSNATMSWRAVDSRTEVQGQMRAFMRQLKMELSQASLSNIWVFGNRSGDTYQHGIMFETALNDGNPAGGNNSNPNGPLGDPVFYFSNPHDPLLAPAWQGWVLYYVTRPSPAQHAADVGFNCQGDGVAAPETDGLGNPIDNTCPHKWLVRKEVLLKLQPHNETDLNTGANAVIESVTNPPNNSIYGEVSAPGSIVTEVKVFAKEVLSFNIIPLDATAHPAGGGAGVNGNGQPNASTAMIEVDAKFLRLVEASREVPIGQTAYDLTTTPFTVQVNETIVPANP